MLEKNFHYTPTGKMNRNTFLKVSLALNVVLFAAVIVTALRPPEIRNLSAPAPEQPVAEPAPNESAHFKVASAQAQKPPSGDWRDWIELVRTAAPNHVLAAMVQADFDARWQKGHEELYRRYVNGEVEIDALSVHGIQREVELDANLLAAMGEEKFRAWDQNRKFFDINLESLKLSESETASLYEIRKGLAQRLRELEIARHRKEIDPATYDERRINAQADYERQAQALLGFERSRPLQPAGLSADMQRSLRDFNLGAEHIAAFENLESQWIQKQADLRNEVEQGIADAVTHDKQMEELREWRRKEFQQVLGEEAFEYYERQQDARYVDLKNYATQWRISEQEIEQIYQTLRQQDKAMQEYQRQLNLLEASGDTVKQDEIKNAVQQTSVTITQQLANLLGPDRFDVLQRNQILSR
jgi:hypothetical protein